MHRTPSPPALSTSGSQSPTSTRALSALVSPRRGDQGHWAPAWGGRDIAFRATDQLSTQAPAALFRRLGVAFSPTHRLWAEAPGEEREAWRQELV